MSTSRPKQVILGAHFPGVNSTTVWSDPEAKSQIEFQSFVDLARTAERGRFDFFFLAEGLRLREQAGRIYDLDVVGRPDTLTVLTALASVTDHLGLTGTLNATFHEAYEVARQVATLDHLSGGRAGWNVVTSSDAFTGENFRRGGFLDHSQRYERAREIIDAARTLWGSWGDDELIADPLTGRFVRSGPPGAFAYHGHHFDIHGHFNVPTSPQRQPVILQAGDSDPGRELAAATADAIFSRHSSYEAGRAFHADIMRRLPRYGRTPADIRVLPAATFALGDTPEDADENARDIRNRQVSPQTALRLAEQLWNRDLSERDPDGPLPPEEPDLTSTSIIQGRARMFPDPVATVRQWRELAAAKNLSLRGVVVENLGRQTFIGTPEQVAETIDRHVQDDAADGFILVPHLTPSGLDPFVDRVVPLLQERGVLRAEYETTTLRGHLGLPEIPRQSSLESA